jgi:uncharacterized protein
MKGLYTIALLFLSNIFMTFAWYGHLKNSQTSTGYTRSLLFTILISWGIAFFEYCLMVPANRFGSKLYGGPFTVTQLKIIQEAISLIVFMLFVLLYFKHEPLKWNHAVGFGCILLAVYFIFK